MHKREEWIAKCNHWKNKWPTYNVVLHSDDSNGLDIYAILNAINVNLTKDDIIMTDAGSPSYACPVTLEAVTANQFIFNPSQADMGWAVPASIGVALNAGDKHTIVIVGDGSFYSNMQELAVIKHHNLPIRFFVLNNNGYLSIRNTQSKYFENRVWGVDSTSGLTFPPLEKVADTFGLSYKKISNLNELTAQCNELMHEKNPCIIELMCKEDQEILPAQALKTLSDGTKVQAPLHDMIPFLSNEELEQEVHPNLKWTKND